MNFFDTIKQEVENGATVLAKDWIGALTDANKPKSTAAAANPAPSITDQAITVVSDNKPIIYVALALAAAGILFAIFGRGK